MVPRGLEPRTLRLLAVRSNQLSYETLDVCLEVALFHAYHPFHAHSWHNNHFFYGQMVAVPHVNMKRAVCAKMRHFQTHI